MDEWTIAKCKSCNGQLQLNPDAETTVCPYCGTSYITAQLMGESENTRMERIRIRTEKEMQEKHYEQQNKMLEKAEKQEALKTFKKSKFSKTLLVFFVIAVLFAVGCFIGHAIVGGLVAVLMAGLFLTSYLMGMQVIPEKRKNLRILPAIVAFVLFIPMFAAIASHSDAAKTGQYTWNDIILAQYLPEADMEKASVELNSETHLEFTVRKTDFATYKTYVENCKKLFTTDIECSMTQFNGFNDENYVLAVNWEESDKDIHVSLKQDKVLTETEWPTDEIYKKIPKPTFTGIEVETVSIYDIQLEVGGITPDAFYAYIVECQKKGFTEGANTSDYSFSAKNEKGDRIHVELNLNQRMEIEFDKFEPTTAETTTKESTTKPSTTANQAETTTKKSSGTGLRPEFKKAMDSYEKFIDEYIAFMKKYSSSDDILSMMNDYLSYMNKLSEMEDAFDKWEDEDLNDAELAYYLQVQTRVSTKLMSVAMG